MREPEAMIPQDPPTPELMRLLVAIRSLAAVTACLLALLLLGLGVGSWLAVQRLERLAASTQVQAEGWRSLSAELGAELRERQEGLSSGLVAESQQTNDRIAAFGARRRALSGSPPDPLGKLDRVIDLNALIADELLLLLQNASNAQATVGRSLRPLPRERGKR